MALVFLRRDFRIDFTAHAQYGCFRDARRHEKSFPSHTKVALWIIGSHAPLISKGDTNRVPRKIVSIGCDAGVNRSRRVPARERDSEFVAFANSFARLLKDKVSGVCDEVVRANYLPISFHVELRSLRARTELAD